MWYIIIGAIGFFVAIYCGVLTGSLGSTFICFIVGAVGYVIYELIKKSIAKNNEHNQPTNNTFNNNAAADVETAKQNNTFSSKVEDVEKLKKLLDEGVITKEEFEIKKKELLGLWKKKG